MTAECRNYFPNNDYIFANCRTSNRLLNKEKKTLTPEYQPKLLVANGQSV